MRKTTVTCSFVCLLLCSCFPLTIEDGHGVSDRVDVYLFRVGEPRPAEGSKTIRDGLELARGFVFPVEWHYLQWYLPHEEGATEADHEPYTEVIYLEAEDVWYLFSLDSARRRAPVSSCGSLSITGLGIGETALMLLEKTRTGERPHKAVVLTGAEQASVGWHVVEGKLLRVTIVSYDPAKRCGTLSVEYADVEEGKVITHAFAKEIVFRPNEIMEFRRERPKHEAAEDAAEGEKRE